MEIDGVAAVVAGGASGLGAATSRELAHAGAKVAIFDLNRDLGTRLASELNGVFVHCDVADETSATNAFFAASIISRSVASFRPNIMLSLTDRLNSVVS